MANVVAICGSLRKGSFNRQLMNASIGLAPAGMTITEAPSFAKLPIYNFDDQQSTGFPKDSDALHEAVTKADGVLFVSAEYNWSIPGGLKNAIDWASRPYGQNSFTRKPSAVIGTSPGAIGTAIAQQQLRSVLSFCNSPQMNAPEAYIQSSRARRPWGKRRRCGRLTRFPPGRWFGRHTCTRRCLESSCRQSRCPYP